MKTIIIVTLASLLLAVESHMLTSQAAVPYESDDYGFPVESTSAARRNTRSGKSFWANRRASRSLSHACDYSRDIYRYSRDARRIEPTVAESESEGLGGNITKAQQELAAVRQQAGNHRETINALKSIEEHLSKAADRHEHLHEECCKTSVDGIICMKCCSDITLHLDRAMAEHAALLRLLEIGDVMSQEEAPAAHEHN